MEQRCAREIEELHTFFVAWFTGTIPRTEANFARFTAAIAPDFALISPGGALLEHEDLVAWIRDAYGSRTHFRIWIENFRLRRQLDGAAVVTYEEWQESDDGVTARLSTAVFLSDPSAPNGVRWLHVHETWMARQGDSVAG
jgi:hypothetical protein